MILYPAIDLLGGKVVRLRRGKRSDVDVYSDDPVAVARDFAARGALVEGELNQLEGAGAAHVPVEAVAVALDVFLGDDGVAGVGEGGEEGGAGVGQGAGDLEVAGGLGLVEHGETRVVGVLAGAVERVGDVLSGEGACVVVIRSGEVDALADLEDVGDAVVGDFPAGGQGGHELGELVVVLNEAIAGCADDLALVSARVMDGVELGGGGGEGHREGAALLGLVGLGDVGAGTCEGAGETSGGEGAGCGCHEGATRDVAVDSHGALLVVKRQNTNRQDIQYEEEYTSSRITWRY